MAGKKIYFCNVCGEDFEGRENPPPRICKKCGSWKWNIPKGKISQIQNAESKGINPELLKETVKMVYEEIKKENTSQANKENETIFDKIEKWAPLAIQFVDGLSKGIQRRAEIERMRKPSQPPTPPPYYDNIALQTKYGYRYWDEATKSMRYTPAYQKMIDEWEAWLLTGRQTPNVEYPEDYHPPKINQQIPQYNDSSFPLIEEEKMIERRKQQTQSQEQTKELTEQDLEVIKVQSNLKKCIDWLDKLDNKVMMSYVDNAEEWVNKLKGMINPLTKPLVFSFIPKDVLENLTFMDIFNLIKENCPDKFELLKNKKHDLEYFYNELKSALFGEPKDNKTEPEEVDKNDEHSGGDGTESNGNNTDVISESDKEREDDEKEGK